MPNMPVGTSYLKLRNKILQLLFAWFLAVNNYVKTLIDNYSYSG